MKYRLLLLCLFPCWLLATDLPGQDSIFSLRDTTTSTIRYPETASGLEFSPKQLIAPTTLIALGVYGMIDGGLDKKIQKQAVKWNGNTMMDDVLTFVPGASIYVLDWCGIPSKHNFVDKTVISSTSAIFTLGTVYLLKKTVKEERPRGDNDHSFPSGHAAIAFAGAELLRQEYGHRSVWYGVAGYGIAASVGFLRIYNNSHWLSDVLGGAGIGILSVKASYWLYPYLRNLYDKKDGKTIAIYPYGSSQGFGIGFSARF